MGIPKKQLDRMVGLLAVSQGQFNHLGSDSETRIKNLLRGHSITDVLTMTCIASHHGDLDVGGYIQPMSGQPVVVTNNALAAIVSIALSMYSKVTPFPVELCVRTPLKGTTDVAMAKAAVCVNDDFQPHYDKTNNETKTFLRIWGPNLYLQERLSCVIRNLMARANALFALLPNSQPGCSAPLLLDQFVSDRYGITTQEIATALFAFWAATQGSGDWLLWDATFANIPGWPNNYLGRFLEKFAVRFPDFGEPWKAEPTMPDRIALRIPKILETPIIEIGNLEGRPIYALPFRRALFHYFEESFYWACFDHFRDLEKHSDNTFSNWFGKVFEAYCHQLLAAVGTTHYSSLKFLEQSNIAGPDGWEDTAESTTFFEFKARRIRRQHCLEGNEKSEKAIYEVAKDIVDGYVRFAEQWDRNPAHPLKKARGAFAKHVSFVAITPSQFPINPMIEKCGWFHDEIKKIQVLLKLKNPPKLLFGSVKDLEGIPRTRANGTFIGNLWKQFSKDEDRELLTLYEWLMKKRRGIVSSCGINPYLSSIIDQTAREAQKLFVSTSDSDSTPH
jgi:hypothetical protein